MALMQSVTGGSRPGETNHDSEWRPFNDNNSVSGHSFFGAVPFLTVARMNPDRKVLKYAAYVSSGAAAWSRISDDRHYPSQAALGWYMAWESVDAVFDADEERKERKMSAMPLIGQDSYGIAFSVKW